MSELIISVSQLNTYIKNIFDSEEMLIGVKVVGEITNLKPSSRAIYFDLKDENASLSCVVFDETLMEDFKFGDKVTLKGKLNYYVKGGKLSFVVSKIEKFGVGDLYQEYLNLKEKLEKEGLFDESHKKPLPSFVKRVGVVTSRTGAVIRDIIRVKNAKNHWSDIVLYPVKVQGIGAKEEIIKGIEFLDEYGVDVIIVARGGGSFEDYQPFNTEEVVRAVFRAKTPIISAIGHENDWSLIDFVADKRASTPSVASEMAFFSEEFYIKNLVAPLYTYLTNLSKTSKKDFLDNQDLINDIQNSFKRTLEIKTEKLKNLSNNLLHKIEKVLEKNKAHLDLSLSKLSALNPMEILKRGYGKLAVGNKNISSVLDCKEGDDAQITLFDGTISAKIIEVKEKKL